jgi:hypothetical protein
MAKFIDWKIKLNSDDTTGVNKNSSNVIEFYPFNNT